MCSAKTRERFGELIANQIKPHIGALPLQKLRPIVLTELYAKLLREGRGDGSGLSASTVGHVHRLLHRALGHAAQWDVIQTNIAGLVRAPRVAATEIEIIREEQIREVLAELRGQTLGPWRPPCWQPACGAANCWRFDGPMSTSTAPS